MSRRHRHGTEIRADCGCIVEACLLRCRSGQLRKIKQTSSIEGKGGSDELLLMREVEIERALFAVEFGWHVEVENGRDGGRDGPVE